MDFQHFREHKKIDCDNIIKQQVFDADPKIILQISSIRAPDRDAGALAIFVLKESKKYNLELPNSSMKVTLFWVNII